MNMNKKLHATIGLSAAILALGLSSSALADEQELPVSLPATEALDNTSFENLVVENIPASAVDVNLTSESVSTTTTANPATEVYYTKTLPFRMRKCKMNQYAERKWYFIGSQVERRQ